MASSSSPTNEYIYTLKLKRPALLTEGPTPEEAQIIDAHWSHLVDLNQKGIVLFCGRTTTLDESTFGIVVFKSESWEKAGEIMQGDPVISQGVMHGEVFPFQVFLKEMPKPLAQ
jgi:uncharacterized protein